MRKLAFLVVAVSCLAGLAACDDGPLDLNPVNVGGTPPPPDPVPRIAMDFAGNGIAAWNDNDSVVARVYDGAAGVWGPEEAFASEGGDVEDVSVAMYAVDMGLVAWAQGDEIRSMGYDRLGGGWEGSATRVDDGLNVEVAAFVFDSTSPNVFATWRKVLQPDPFTQFAAAFGARHLTTGWQDRDRLDTNASQTGSRPQTVFFPRVAAGGLGHAVAAWQVHVDATGDVASFASRYVGGVWSDPERLGPADGAPGDTAADGHPDVGMDADGNALAVYIANGLVMGHRLERASQTWTTPSQVDDHPGTAMRPCIAVNADGKAIAVWSKAGTGRIHASRYTPGAGWSPSQIIDIDPQGNPTAVGAPRGICVAIDADGRGRALWSVNAAVWTVEYDGAFWLFAERVGLGERTDLAMAPNGRAIGVWWNADGFQSRVWEPLAPPPPPIAGTLIFATNPFGDFELYTMQAVDGSQRTRRSLHSAEDTDPVWSPDGAQACFVSTRNAPEFSPDSTDLYLWDAAGTGQVIRLTYFSDDGGRARDPAWSRDGTRIAFSAGYRGQESIRVLDVVSTNHVALTMGPNDRWPTWFRDDSRIAYSGDGDLRMVDPGQDASQAPIVVQSRANTDESPAFSPDGETIAFAARGPLAHGIQTVDLTTGTVVTLTSTDGDRRPAWSPDGEHIAFVRDDEISTRIWIMEKDGQDLHEVPGQTGDNDDPDWKE